MPLIDPGHFSETYNTMQRTVEAAVRGSRELPIELGGSSEAEESVSAGESSWDEEVKALVREEERKDARRAELERAGRDARAGSLPWAQLEVEQVAPPASLEVEQVAPLASLKMEQVAPLASLEMEQVAPLASLEMEQVAPLASLEMGQVAPLASLPEDPAADDGDDELEEEESSDSSGGTVAGGSDPLYFSWPPRALEALNQLTEVVRQPRPAPQPGAGAYAWLCWRLEVVVDWVLDLLGPSALLQQPGEE